MEACGLWLTEENVVTCVQLLLIYAITLNFDWGSGLN